MFTVSQMGLVTFIFWINLIQLLQDVNTHLLSPTTFDSESKTLLSGVRYQLEGRSTICWASTGVDGAQCSGEFCTLLMGWIADPWRQRWPEGIGTDLVSENMFRSSSLNVTCDSICLNSRNEHKLHFVVLHFEHPSFQNFVSNQKKYYLSTHTSLLVAIPVPRFHVAKAWSCTKLCHLRWKEGRRCIL